MKKNFETTNNLQDINTSTMYDENYIKESLREYANILYEYLMIVDNNAKK